MLKKNVIIGYSGHAFVVLDVLKSKNINVEYYCEKEEKINNPFDLSYLGNENSDTVVEELINCNVYLGIGNNLLRSKIFQFLLKERISLPFAIHSNVFVSPMANIGNGTVVMPGAVINALAKIGRGVICNSSSTIEHECEISDFAHIAPGATLAGNVKIGCNTFVGANAVIKEGVIIGSNVIIGAGTVVINNIPNDKKIVGNPSRFI